MLSDTIKTVALKFIAEYAILILIGCAIVLVLVYFAYKKFIE